jgi:hypothetical protein
VSGRKLAATAPMTFITHSTMPTVTFEADEMTMKGEQKAPNLEKATHIAWPTVRMSVEYSSGVVTHVAFCTKTHTNVRENVQQSVAIRSCRLPRTEAAMAPILPVMPTTITKTVFVSNPIRKADSAARR